MSSNVELETEIDKLINKIREGMKPEDLAELSALENLTGSELELLLLRNVFEAARSVLRNNGVDKERFAKAFIELESAVEDVICFNQSCTGD